MEQKTIHDEKEGKRRRSRHGFWAGVVLGGLLGAALVGGVLLTGAQAKAAGILAGGHGHFGYRSAPPSPEVMREHSEFAIDWALSRVDASEDQSERVKAIVGDSIDELYPIMQQHRDSHRAFVTELSKPTIDRAALEELRKSGLEMADQASSRLVTALADVAEVLTPEQRNELLELAERFHRR